MLTKRVALLCLPILAASLQTAAARPAHADVTDVDSAACTVTATVSTFPGPVLQAISFQGSMVLGCTGVGDEVGTWTLTMSGQVSPGFCAGGRGLANVSGSGPDGSFSGTMEIAVNASSWSIAANLSSANDDGTDAFQATVRATPTSGVPCVNASTTLSLAGSGTISDLQPPAEEVVCTASGNDAYNPGLTVTTADRGVTVNLLLSCTQGSATDDIGTWTASMSGDENGDCGEGTGQASGTGSSPHDGAVSAAIIYNRVGTMIEVEGDLYTGHDHSLFAWLTAIPTGNCATTAWTSSSLTGAAALVGS
jgi:hypothetical protein